MLSGIGTTSGFDPLALWRGIDDAARHGRVRQASPPSQKILPTAGIIPGQAILPAPAPAGRQLDTAVSGDAGRSRVLATA